MTEISVQPNNRSHPVGLWKDVAEYSVMSKRGPYKTADVKAAPPRWRKNSIAQCRKAKGWTQERLAEAVDMSVGQISDLEQGKSGYSPESLQAIADALDVTRGQLLDGPALDQAQPVARTAKARAR